MHFVCQYNVSRYKMSPSQLQTFIGYHHQSEVEHIYVSGFWWNVAPDRCHENPTTAAIVITGKANKHDDTHKLVYKLNKLKSCICDGIKCGQQLRNGAVSTAT